VLSSQKNNHYAIIFTVVSEGYNTCCFNRRKKEYGYKNALIINIHLLDQSCTLVLSAGGLNRGFLLHYQILMLLSKFAILS
jgi:hypothetical protein